MLGLQQSFVGIFLLTLALLPVAELTGQNPSNNPNDGPATLHGELELAPVLSVDLAGGEDQPRLGFSGNVLTMIESRQQNLRAELSLKLLPLFDSTLGIPLQLDRAALRVRLPIPRGPRGPRGTRAAGLGLADEAAAADPAPDPLPPPYYFRITLGKTVLPWGEGFVFNSGDLPGSSTSLLGSLSGSSLRNTSSWLLALNFPLGRFSFVELLGQVADWEADLAGGKPLAPNIGRNSAGLRFLLQAGTVKFEFGGLYKGETVLSDTGENRRSLRSYFGIKSALGDVDFYLQSSLTWLLYQGEPRFAEWQDTKRYMNASAGFMWQAALSQSTNLSLRLEAITSPFAAWEAVSAAPQTAAGQPVYGLFIYPELALSHNQFQLFFRSLISPVDASALLSLGWDWSPYTGLSLYAYGSVALGGEDAVFRWQGDRNGAAAVGVTLAAGMRYSF